tara:strand:+ start:554 stop:2197 length:1644 start_codon:yes stop_codon:yes gene_type:complete
MIKRYIKIFDGYRRAYGTAELKNAKVDPEKGGKLVIPKGDYGWTHQELTEEIYEKHLEGTLSIGVQPCNENSEAKFGVIDIDPKDYVDFDRQYIIEKIQEYKLPLVPVLSKSGGLHLYLFMNEFVLATVIVSFLSNLLSLFKLKSNNEIFPKQTQLTKDPETGKTNVGFFINLPYFKKTERLAINLDGTTFTFEQFIEVAEANMVNVEDLKNITERIENKDLEGVDEEFDDGPPCLAHLSKIMKNPGFDGKDRFMYNYHVFVKMKYGDNWQQRVMNAPVKYFEPVHANAWDKQTLTAKVRSWSKSEKGYTCTQSPISDYCKKGVCVKKKFGILAGSKGSYPVLANLRKIDIQPDPEYEFVVTKPDGIGKASVFCKSIEHLTDQRKRRNSIAVAAGFPPPIVKGEEDQMILTALFATQKVINPPIGTSPKEKLHDVIHAKINGPKAMNDAAFKSGTVLIEEGFAYFRFEKFYDKLKSKNWKYSEDKTGVMMKTNYEKCGIDFLKQKRFPAKDKGKYNTPTNNIVMISIKEFEDVQINHTIIKHNTEIM